MLAQDAVKNPMYHDDFVNSIDTGYVGGWDYELARGYLARMDADPNCPPWIAQPKTRTPE